MSTTTHILRLRPPVRTLALAAAFAVVGAVFVVAPEAFSWDVITRFIGLGFLVVCVLLLALAGFAMSRGRMRIELDDAGYRIEGGTGARPGNWADVVRVTRAEGQIVLYDRDGAATVLGRPRGGLGDLDSLGTDIARRLDASRGYGSVPFGPADPES